MNDKIKQLKQQAIEAVDIIDIDNMPIQQYLHEIDKKFAELIIKQCGYHADIFNAAGCPVDMDPVETKPSDYIKQHFEIK